MRIEQSDPSRAKGWYFGPWNSDLAVSVGYATTGVDEPHYHRAMSEVYLIASGSASLRVNGQEIELRPGMAVVIEPGEAHIFLAASPNYFHFVLHTPALQGAAAQADKVPVTDR
jgi:quercetin dioxygenase-like cupin family protein